jgi:hypothetical protein
MKKSRSIATKYSREADLLEPASRFARRRGFYLQQVELPFYEYRIDLYGFCHRRDSTVAIELKLSNWRRALVQALLYQLCSDLVYIAMPKRAALKVDQSLLTAEGVGLLAVNDSGSCLCVLAARSHAEVRQTYRISQINYLKGTTCA